MIFLDDGIAAPLDSLLSHELVHSAQRDGDSGYANLEAEMISLLSPLEKKKIEEWLGSRGYDTDQIQREIVPYLVGSSISSHQEMDIKDLSNADAIKQAARDYYERANGFNPSGLTDISDDDLLQGGFALGRATVTPTSETRAFPTKDGGVIGPAAFSIGRTPGESELSVPEQNRTETVQNRTETEQNRISVYE